MGNVSNSEEERENNIPFRLLFHENSELNHDVSFAAKNKDNIWVTFPAMAQHCADASPVFNDIIQSFSSKTPSRKLIKLDDTDAEMLEILLRFIHGFAVNIDHSRILDVRLASQLYAVNDLRDYLDFYRMKNISASNFCSTLIGFSGDVERITLCLQQLQYIRVEKHKKILMSKSFLFLRMIPELSLLVQSPYLHVEESLLRKRCKEWGQQNRFPQNEKSIDRHISAWLAIRSNKVLKSKGFYIHCLPNHMETIQENESDDAQSEHQIQAMEAETDSDFSAESDDTMFDQYVLKGRKKPCKGVLLRYFGLDHGVNPSNN